MAHIAIGSDHGGFRLKQEIMALLAESEHEFEDFGCYDTESVDYPDIAVALANAVSRGNFDHGILICSTGIGMSIAANKIKGIRAALCHDTFSARRAREHNDANVLCLGEWVIGKGLAREIVSTYLTAGFTGGRHSLRVEKINALRDQ